MNRRSFFKAVTGFVAGMVAAFVPSKTIGKIKPASAGIDPNSEWAKQKPLTINELVRFEERNNYPWDKLGCKDCYKECKHFDDCLNILERLRIEAAEKAANPLYIVNPSDEKEEFPTIWSTWSSVDGVAMCRLEKGKWHNVVIQTTDFSDNCNISIT